MASIKVPPLGESIVEATVSRWLKNEGDAVAPGDALVELETDKITVEVPSMSAGVLAKRSHAEGDVVKVGDVLGDIDEQGQPRTGAAAQSPAPSAPIASTSKPAAPSVPSAAPSPTPPAPPPQQPAQPQRVSPAAQRVAAERGLDTSRIQGTGRGGVVSKADVIAQQAAPPARNTPAAPAPSAPVRASGSRETREAMSTRRKRIAEHLLEAQHATAHLTTFNEVDMSAVMALRGRHKDRVEKEHGVKLTFMPFFVRAACSALKQYPSVNSQVDGDAIIYKHYVHMGVAVASDAGLVVPVLKDADAKGLIEISRDISALAIRARDGKLTMDDLTGGSFTITNGGVFGSLVSTPILNYPQVGILGLHKIEDRPVAIDGRVEIRPMMYLALSYDHRVVEGQHAVQFLVRVKELMEDPASMLLE